MSKMDELIKTLNKGAKEEIVRVGLTEYNYTRIPFTSPRLNYCTYGGLPVGKIVEFFGEEHGGKTTTALDIIANYQQMEDGRKVLYIDAENTLDAEWARKVGVDVDDMIILKPTSQSAEQIFQFILDSIETDEIGLWVLDSIGVLCSQQELGKTMEEKTYAGISAPLTVFGRKAEMLMQRHKCTGIGINQIRDDLNAMWAGAVKTPGGRAWKHYCSVRMQFSRGDFLDEKGNSIKRSSESPAGNVVLAAIVKNKTAPPNRRIGFYTINYEIGIDYIRDLIDVASKYGCIDKRGAWFTLLNPDTGEVYKDSIQGQANVYTFLDSDEGAEALEAIEQYVSEKLFD